MLNSQRFIVIITGNIARAEAVIKGFKACTVVKTVDRSLLMNVWHFNKNAVYFSDRFYSWLNEFNPIVIQITKNTTDYERMLLSSQNILSDFPKMLKSKGIDCGDHTSNSTNANYIQPKSDCLFCKVLNKTADNPEHILYESKSFFVIPGTGAFFDGYLMIIPKRHVMSFANLNPEELEEFFIVYNNISAILEDIYHKPIFGFECGSGKTGAGKHKTSIVHCHFHMAPTDMPVLEEVQKSGLNPQLILKEELPLFSEDPYMLYVDQRGNWFISCDKRDYYPRQHPRQVLAHWMVINEKSILEKHLETVISNKPKGEIEYLWNSEEFYNWRIYPLRNRLDIIATEFRSYCERNFAKLLPMDRRSVRFDD